MKKIISLLILGCFSLYGFSINPIDPPAKKGEPVKTITQPSPVVTKECSESRGSVEVTVYVTFTDCPDYECEFKTCEFNICIYDHNYSLITCQTFDPVDCDYTFEDIMAEEYYDLHALIVPKVTLPPCTDDYNDTFADSTYPVPQGGGDMYINTTLCQ